MAVASSAESKGPALFDASQISPVFGSPGLSTLSLSFRLISILRFPPTVLLLFSLPLSSSPLSPSPPSTVDPSSLPALDEDFCLPPRSLNSAPRLPHHIISLLRFKPCRHSVLGHFPLTYGRHYGKFNHSGPAFPPFIYSHPSTLYDPWHPRCCPTISGSHRRLLGRFTLFSRP